MIKSAQPKKIARTASTLTLMCIALIFMDALYCLTMRQVWANKASDNHSRIAFFDYIRPFVIVLTIISIILKLGLVSLLYRLSISEPEDHMSARDLELARLRDQNRLEKSRQDRTRLI